MEGKPVVVVGLARSGVAAASLLARQGRRVVATDRKPAGELPAEVRKLEELGITLQLGTHDAATWATAAEVVVSPGVPWDLPELQKARAAGIPVIGELELGFRHLLGRVVAVTGTKGKSTTTAALGAMLKEHGGDVRVGGNIGEAVTGLVEGSTPATTFVLEVSSFQLEGTTTFHPHVSVFLNLSTDHLDRHASFEEYAAAKARIFAHQTGADFAVVNADDPRVMALARDSRARLVRFGEGQDADARFVGTDARVRTEKGEATLFSRGDVRLPGAHLASDMLVAGTAATLLGAAPDAVRRAVVAFQGVEHVLERVEEIRGVAFYNDSKATNVDAVLKSIEAFTTPVLPILGGRYKGGDFAILREALSRRGRAVLAIGEAQDRVAEALRGAVDVVRCGSLREAVEQALTHARPGDTVLLAPGCSSFDMFTDYAHRGRAFKDEVRALAARTLDG